MSGHRQAALALYALAESDQSVILAELPVADQAILRGLLDELAELGFDKAANSSLHQPSRPPAGEAHAALMRAPASAMLAVLQAEPAPLIAQLLTLRAFPWADEFLALLPAHRRVLVTEALRGVPAAAPARTEFLLSAAAAALAALPAPARAPAKPFSLSRLWTWTR